MLFRSLPLSRHPETGNKTLLLHHEPCQARRKALLLELPAEERDGLPLPVPPQLGPAGGRLRGRGLPWALSLCEDVREPFAFSAQSGREHSGNRFRLFACLKSTLRRHDVGSVCFKPLPSFRGSSRLDGGPVRQGPRAFPALLWDARSIPYTKQARFRC